MENYWTFIMLGFAAAAFVVAWRKGYIAKLAQYVQETREELRKCSWPSVEELKGSTVVVMVSILVLGIFTILVDSLLVVLVKAITSV